MSKKVSVALDVPLSVYILYVYTFYSRYNTDWIANEEIGLDPNKCYKEVVVHLHPTTLY